MSFRRNLIIVLAHGLRSDALGDSGAWPLSTPNFFKLAQRGLRLVAGSACPADRGGMVSALTGLHARQHGHVEPSLAPVRCDGWAAWLRGAGYHVAGVGCVAPIEPWLHQSVYVADVDAPGDQGCAYLHAMAVKGTKAAIIQQRKQRQRYGPFEPDRLLLDPDDDIDGYIMVHARQMLAKMPTDQPWALIVVLSGPGNDLPPPTIYTDIVDVSAVDGGFIPADLTQTDSLAEPEYPRVLLQRLESHRLARIRADYLGRVSLIDYGLGRLAAVLKSRPDAERTWTVVGSDRGHLLGEHGLVGSRSFLCGALETPMIVSPPLGVTERQEPEYGVGLFSTVDLAPTIAQLAGCDAPTAVAGRSVVPLLARDFPQVHQPFADEPLDSRPDWRQSSLSEMNRRLLLETERHKIVFDTETRVVIGLYDMLNDPLESQNLVGTPAGINLLDSLRWRLGEALLSLRAMPSHGAA